jgi:hypothetical protein
MMICRSVEEQVLLAVVLFFVLSRLRFEISRLRLRFFAGVQSQCTVLT